MCAAETLGCQIKVDQDDGTPSEKSTADVSGVTLCQSDQSAIRSEKGLALETSAVVSLTASITLINTHLIHQFVFCRSDAVT